MKFGLSRGLLLCEPSFEALPVTLRLREDPSEGCQGEYDELQQAQHHGDQVLHVATLGHTLTLDNSRYRRVTSLTHAICDAAMTLLLLTRVYALFYNSCHVHYRIIYNFYA